MWLCWGWCSAAAGKSESGELGEGREIECSTPNWGGCLTTSPAPTISGRSARDMGHNVQNHCKVWLRTRGVLLRSRNCLSLVTAAFISLKNRKFEKQVIIWFPGIGSVDFPTEGHSVMCAHKLLWFFTWRIKAAREIHVCLMWLLEEANRGKKSSEKAAAGGERAETQRKGVGKELGLCRSRSREDVPSLQWHGDVGTRSGWP